jgi:hypothetical protein
MNFLALLGAIATIVGAGSVFLLLLPAQGRPGVPTQLALSWIFGTGLVSLFIWLLGFFLRAPLLPGVVGAVCITLGLLTIKMRGGSAARSKTSGKLGPIELFLGIVIALELVFIFYFSYVHTLGGDGLLNWEVKARYAYANAGALPATYFHDAGRATSHPEYPLAISYTELWLYFWLGETNQFLAKTIFPLFYVAGIVLLVSISRRLTGKTWPGLLVSSLYFFIPQISTETGSAVVGYADFPLSVFYLAAIGNLLCACQRHNDDRDDGAFSIYAVALAMLPWVKREGAILWLIGALCGLFVIWRRKKSPASLLALLPGLFVIVGWHFYLTQMHVVSSSDFMPFSFVALSANIHRLGPIVSMLFLEFIHAEVWSLFWPAAALASGFFLYRFRGSGAGVLIAAIVAPIGIYAGAYIFSSWPDYHDHVALSISRLLMHVAPLAALMIAAVLPSAPRRSSQPATIPLAAGDSSLNVQPLETCASLAGTRPDNVWVDRGAI